MKYWYILLHELWKHFAKLKKPIKKNHIVYDNIYMSCLKFKLYQTQKNTVSFGILCANNFSSDTSQKVSKSDGSISASPVEYKVFNC